MADSPRPLDERQIRYAHETLDRPIERKDERQVRKAEHPILRSIWDPLFAADELEHVGKVCYRRPMEPDSSRERSSVK